MKKLILLPWTILVYIYGFLFYKPYNKKIDTMNGKQFENYIALLLEKLGYHHIIFTPDSKDYGCDIIAEKNRKKYAIQCKRYNKNVGVASVQEAISGKLYYGCDYAMVMTNSYFTRNALQLAESDEVLLYDRDDLRKINYRRHHILYYSLFITLILHSLLPFVIHYGPAYYYVEICLVIFFAIVKYFVF